MTKFMILYRSTTSAREQMAAGTPEQQKAGMDAWMAWAGKVGDAIIDLGAPLAFATQLNQSPGADDITGYSLMQADSTKAVADLLNGHPHLFMPGNSIDVLELLSIPGM